MRTPLLYLTTLVLSSGLNALAQISGGVFRGEVGDSTDAPAPVGRIWIQSDDSSGERWAASNGEGIFVSPDLIPGSYTLTAVFAGFRSEATAAQLFGSESAEIVQVIDRRQVSGMPLNGRRWQQLLTLCAGVNPGLPAHSIDSAANGTTTSAAPARVVQLSARVEF